MLPPKKGLTHYTHMKYVQTHRLNLLIVECFLFLIDC